MPMKKLQYLLAIVCFCVLSAPLAPARAAEGAGNTPLNICVVDDNAPFVQRSPKGALEGFDMDIFQAMALTQPYKMIPVDFPTGLARLEENLCDMVLTNVTVTPERSRRFLFSQPYLRSGLNAMIHKNAPGITSDEDLHGKTIAVLKGSVGDQYVTSHFRDCVILALPTESSIFRAFKENKAHAVVMDRPSLQEYISKYGNAVILEPELAPQAYAYAFSKKNVALRDAVNIALRRLQTEGVIGELYRKWFGAPPPEATR